MIIIIAVFLFKMYSSVSPPQRTREDDDLQKGTKFTHKIKDIIFTIISLALSQIKIQTCTYTTSL